MDNSITLISEFKRDYTKKNLMFWNRKKSKISQAKEWAQTNPVETALLGAASLAALKYGGLGVRSGIRRTAKHLKRAASQPNYKAPGLLTLSKQYLDNSLSGAGKYARKDINTIRQRWSKLTTGKPLRIKYPVNKEQS